FSELGLDPAAHDLTVVKVGYLVPELFATAKGWVIALTPGGVDQDIVRLGHRALERPIFPLDPQMADPDLAPELIGRRAGARRSTHSRALAALTAIRTTPR